MSQPPGRFHPFAATVNGQRFIFRDLADLLAKASPYRSGDALAGVAASTASERVAAQFALADLPLARFLDQAIIPYESDEVTRLIVDAHDPFAFKAVSHLTVGGLRDWLLSDAATQKTLELLSPGLTPEMAAAVSKLCRLQDLMLIAAKRKVVTRFRNTLGLQGRLSTRLHPNHPADDLRGVAASIVDGLLLGSGDAVVGVNPAGDSPSRLFDMIKMLDDLRARLEIPTQTCVLTHVSTTLELIARGAPVDLTFQSIGGTEALNASFGASLSLLDEALHATRSLKRGALGDNVMYFETGQGAALSANAHHGVDQQTLEARAYAVARRYEPLLVNTVVGFIGPEYLYDGPADGVRRLLHESSGGRSGRYGRAADSAGRGGGQLRDGRTRSRRRDVGLSEHILSRRVCNANRIFALGAQSVLVLIGERPGLSATDSLGADVTWGVRPDLTDADRNCVSNMHPEGVDFEQAAREIAYLLSAARKEGFLGVMLNNRADEALGSPG